MSQAELARSLGIQQATLGRLESGGRADPRFTTIVAIAAALGASLDALAIEAGLLAPLPSSNELRLAVRQAVQAARDGRRAIADVDDALARVEGLGAPAKAPR
jgi:transcriptional regulator with XRE-family HTH domain